MQCIFHCGGDLIAHRLLRFNHRVHQTLGREGSKQNTHAESDEDRSGRSFFDRVGTVFNGVVPVFLEGCFCLLRRGLRGHVSPGGC